MPRTPWNKKRRRPPKFTIRKCSKTKTRGKKKAKKNAKKRASRVQAKYEANFYLTDGSRVRRHSPHQGRGDTDRWASKTFDALERQLGNGPERDEVTVREACDRWLAMQNTDQGNKARHLRWICRAWGDSTLVRGVEHEVLYGLPARLAQPMGPRAKSSSRKRRRAGSGRRRRKGDGLQPGTVRAVTQTANSLLAFAFAKGWMLKKHHIKLPVVPITDAEWLRVEELAAVLQATRGTVWGVALHLGARAGLRAGEILELRWSDVDLDAGRLRVRRAWSGKTNADGRKTWAAGLTKGKKARTVPMDPELHAALSAWRGKGARRHDLIVHRDGERVTHDVLLDEVRRGYSAAGIDRPELNTHSLRHSFASHLALGGAAAKQIQHLCGHASLRTTERYMHLAPDQGDAGIRHLPALDLGDSVETESKKPPLRAV